MKLVIPGTPIAKKRPRFARRGNHVAVINQQETEEGLFFLLAKKQIAEAPTILPVALDLRFVLARPKSHFNGKGVLKASTPAMHHKKPDLDNMIKFVKDCLNGLAWVDDCQVCQITAAKEYSLHGAGVGAMTTIIITKLYPEPTNIARSDHP